MRRVFALNLIVGVAWAAGAVAQSSPREANPGPELQRLAYFIGTWRTEGEMKESMFGPAGKLSGTVSHEWVLGKFFYLTRHEEQNPTGKHASMGVTGYDASRQIYIGYSFGGEGGVSRAEGTVSGDTWTWVTEYTVEGRPIKTRTVIKPTSATSYDFTWEIAPHGDDWTVVQTGRSTKVK
jgi:hypothetical protein